MSHDLQRRLGTIEELLHQVESTADPGLRANVRKLVELVMALHGAGLERMVELIRDESVIERLTGDDLVSSLLVLHGLHPLTLEDRVVQALDKVRARGTEVELVGVRDGAVQLRLPVRASRAVKETIETAVYSAAPDLTALTIEGTESFVPLEMLVHNRPVPAGKGGL